MAAPSEHPIASDVIDLAPQLAALDGASRVWLGEGRAPAAAGHPLLADQRADGGWQPPWAQRAASSGLDATCHRLFQAYAAGLPLDTPALLAATEFLARAVTAEGPLRENATLLAEAPAWLAAEDPRAARYLAASAGLWLSVFGTADAAKRALAQSRASDEMEFAQTLWQRAALAARLGAPGAADDLALLATRLDTLAVADLAWMLHALALGGLTSGHPLIDAAAARVLAQRDAPGWATPATLAALRAVGLPLRGSGWRLRALEGREAAALAPAHAALLADAVDGGASVGYLPPLSDAEGLRYANGVADAVAGGGRVLLAALAGEHLIGAAQLDLSPRQNGRHRAEVAKVLVLRAWRGRGVARSLMLALDDSARRLGRSTLVLDTRAGDPSEALYRGVGWTHIGSIPRYARSASGALHATAFYYKLV